MMRYVGCGYARTRLDAFVDDELPIGEQVQVESHLRWCHTCAARVEDLNRISSALRVGARSPRCGSDAMSGEHVHAATDDGLARALATMQAEVLARVGTEYEQSYSVRAQALFIDMRFLWPALGATAAVALSVVMASGVWKATSEDQPMSLAAMIESLADPGSNRNPLRLDGAMYIPRVLDDGVALDGVMLASHAGDPHPEDDVVAIAAVVTREGKIGGFALLDHTSGRQARQVEDVVNAGLGIGMEGVLHAVRQSRFAPAQSPGGRVVAVNMVWLFARTTVKASSHQPVDLGVPLSRPVLVAPPVIKPVGEIPEGASSQEQTSAPLESTTA